MVPVGSVAGGGPRTPLTAHRALSFLAPRGYTGRSSPAPACSCWQGPAQPPTVNQPIPRDLALGGEPGLPWRRGVPVPTGLGGLTCFAALAPVSERRSPYLHSVAFLGQGWYRGAQESRERGTVTPSPLQVCSALPEALLEFPKRKQLKDKRGPYVGQRVPGTRESRSWVPAARAHPSPAPARPGGAPGLPLAPLGATQNRAPQDAVGDMGEQNS